MSGDMNTGLGNCLIMCALVWTYMAEVGLHSDQFELLNNGDDCVVILERHHLEKLGQLNKWFLKRGFTMKIEEPVYELERIEFCQSQPVKTASGYRMVRNPHTCLTKDLISIKNLSTKSAWRFQCQAIADCGMAAFGDIPIYNSFYSMLDNGYNVPITRHCANGLEFAARGLNYKHHVVTDETRYSFYKAFDITPDMQVDLENHYRRFTPTYNPGPVDKYNYFKFNTNLHVRHECRPGWW